MIKKIIDGKMYNTETAKCIAVWGNGKYANDLYYQGFGIYIKKTGEYFLESERGGFPSGCDEEDFCDYYGDGSKFTDGYAAIYPIDEEMAKRLIEINCCTETYVKLFGEVEE